MSKTFRIQFDLTEEAHTRLQKIKEMSGATTKAEVFRASLRLFEWTIKQKQEGKSFIVKDGENEQPVEFLF